MSDGLPNGPERFPSVGRAGRARRRGVAPDGPGNAVSQAATTRSSTRSGRATRARRSRPRAATSACRPGKWENSEVGHLNLGAGAIVKQDLARIDEAIADGSFFENEALKAACARALESGRLHAIALVSDGGVHSGWEHIEAMIELAAAEGARPGPARLHRRPRHPAEIGGRVRRGGPALASPRRPHRDNRWALLGHGPRQPLGPHQARLRCDRARPRPAGG